MQTSPERTSTLFNNHPCVSPPVHPNSRREDPDAFKPRQTMVLVRAFAWRVGAALMLSCIGCGQGDVPTRQEEVELRSEVVYENGIEAVVQVDSVVWQLGRLNATIPDDVEIEGDFQFSLVNRLQDPAIVRYELHFLDENDLLVDVFFPFGQPVELGAGESRQVAGSFVVRLGDVEDLPFVRTLRIVV